MPTKMYFQEVSTNKSTDEIITAIKTAYEPVGGEFSQPNQSLVLNQGVKGISMGFLAKSVANFSIKNLPNGKVEIECQLKWTMKLIWVIALIIGILGFFLSLLFSFFLSTGATIFLILLFGLMFAIPPFIYYFRPQDTYQQCFNRVISYLQ
ncbi:hypothetical protein SDC9_176950 [bioreactor metagenome]|uniref:Uncharacterized protein n=1 Tax=bioreactor metagenome TaxID=1076179 RepID=A0A645GRG1_9ZZZZ